MRCICIRYGGCLHHTYSNGSEPCTNTCTCCVVCRTALVVNATQPGSKGAEVLAAAAAALAATSAALKADKALFESSAAVRALHDTGKCTHPCMSRCDVCCTFWYRINAQLRSIVLRQHLLQNRFGNSKRCRHPDKSPQAAPCLTAKLRHRLCFSTTLWMLPVTVTTCAGSTES